MTAEGKTRRIDLHTHTTASDGTLSPAETVALAAELGISAIAVTDHDTAAGVAEAAEAGARLGVEVVPGIEVNAGWQDLGIHILGYFIDPESPALRELLDEVIAVGRWTDVDGHEFKVVEYGDEEA